MSLEAAVKEICEEMEQAGGQLKPYAKLLRIALKANEGIPDAPPVQKKTCSRCRALWNGDGPHCVACQGDVKMLAEKAQRAAEQVEAVEGKAVRVLDGPLAEEGQDTTASVHPNMPFSTLDAPSYTMIAGHRYKLTKSGLRYAPLSGPGGIIEEANREMSKQIVMGK